MHRAGRTIWFVLAGWLVLAAVTACSSSAPEPHQSQATPTLAPSSAPASGNPRALARQAYLGMWQAFVAASRTADYQSASLAHYAAGDALSLLTRGLYQNYRNGIVTRPAVFPPGRHDRLLERCRRPGDRGRLRGQLPLGRLLQIREAGAR